jgi:hypothetical protein
MQKLHRLDQDQGAKVYLIDSIFVTSNNFVNQYTLHIHLGPRNIVKQSTED